MANPHLHLQQKGATLLQQLQLLSTAFSRFCLYEDLFFETVMFRYYFTVYSLLSRSGALPTPSCHHQDKFHVKTGLPG
jgi:hypothetical protein